MLTYKQLLRLKASLSKAVKSSDALLVKAQGAGRVRANDLLALRKVSKTAALAKNIIVSNITKSSKTLKASANSASIEKLLSTASQLQTRAQVIASLFKRKKANEEELLEADDEILEEEIIEAEDDDIAEEIQARKVKARRRQLAKRKRAEDILEEEIIEAEGDEVLDTEILEAEGDEIVDTEIIESEDDVDELLEADSAIDDVLAKRKSANRAKRASTTKARVSASSYGNLESMWSFGNR